MHAWGWADGNGMVPAFSTPPKGDGVLQELRGMVYDDDHKGSGVGSVSHTAMFTD
jgi:hypothetical protein